MYVILMQAWKKQFPEFEISRCIEFKFKMDGTSDPFIKIIPQSQEHCEIAMEPSLAEVKSIALLLCVYTPMLFQYNEHPQL